MFFHLAGLLTPAQLQQIQLLRGVDQLSPMHIGVFESCTVIGVSTTSPKLHVLRPILRQFAMSVSEHVGEFDPAGPCPLGGESGPPIYIQARGAKLQPLLEDFNWQRSTKAKLAEVQLEIHAECSAGCMIVWAKNPADTRSLMHYLGQVGFSSYLVHANEPATVALGSTSVCNYH